MDLPRSFGVVFPDYSGIVPAHCAHTDVRLSAGMSNCVP